MLAPWRKSYDQPRQHIKKQRHHFANKGPHSQSYGFSSSHVWMWELDHKERAEELMLCSQSLGKSVLNIHWKDWCWSWNSNTLSTWYEELTHWKRPWCWERLKAGGKGDDRAWDGWMASLTWWTWVWGNSGLWWRTGGPGVLQSMGLQRVGHDWATEQQQSSSSGSPAWSAISVITCVPPQRKALGYSFYRHTTFIFSGSFPF